MRKIDTLKGIIDTRMIALTLVTTDLANLEIADHISQNLDIVKTDKICIPGGTKEKLSDMTNPLITWTSRNIKIMNNPENLITNATSSKCSSNKIASQQVPTGAKLSQNTSGVIILSRE